MHESYTILEIGSGSFKLHKEGSFSKKFQSALGKGLIERESYSILNAASVELALNNVKKQIIPFLHEQKVNLAHVLVFATAAVRRSINDPGASGKNFIFELENLGFQGIRIFSEDDECIYAAKGVLEELNSKFTDKEEKVEIESIAILDVGGASHQLMEIKNGEVFKHVSVPVGSHANLCNQSYYEDQSFSSPGEPKLQVNANFRQDSGDMGSGAKLQNFRELGFAQQKNLVIIGTSGAIINAVPNISPERLQQIKDDLLPLAINQRREYLEKLISDQEIHKLFVDYRLAILPNAFAIILNCAHSLEATSFIACSRQAMHYVSKHGFDNSTNSKHAL